MKKFWIKCNFVHKNLKKWGLAGKITTLLGGERNSGGGPVRIFPKGVSKKRGAQGMFFDALTAEMFSVFAY